MYLFWNKKTITDFSDSNIESLYNDGFVFTRLGKGVMHQTRSARIDLSKFELSSENRRILKKVEGLCLEKHPIPYLEYSWEIGKIAKDFYTSRDADFSANKIKELLTDDTESNFNILLAFEEDTIPSPSSPFQGEVAEGRRGYAICYQSPTLLHYSYPFYDLSAPKDTGLGMMLKAILWAKENGKKYFYIGSLERPTDVYKL